MKKISILVILLLLLTGSSQFAGQANAKVLWNGNVLVKGQIGLLAVKKPINLWERRNGKLFFVRVLQVGEKYRVYGADKSTNQFKVGGNYLITNIRDRVEYTTPSKQKLQLLTSQNILENAELVNKIVVARSDLLKSGEALKIKTRISKLPLGMLEKLRQKQVTILLIDQPLTNLPEFAYLKGQTPRGWENTGKTWEDVPGAGGGKQVIIRLGFSDYGKGHGSLNLELHETAHTIDHLLYNNISTTKEFRNIWEKESRNLFGSHHYYKSYPEEYFAEVFAMFYYGADSKLKLKKFAPLTYTLLENLN